MNGPRTALEIFKIRQANTNEIAALSISFCIVPFACWSLGSDGIAECFLGGFQHVTYYFS